MISVGQGLILHPGAPRALKPSAKVSSYSQPQGLYLGTQRRDHRCRRRRRRLARSGQIGPCLADSSRFT